VLINSVHIPTEYRIVSMASEESQWPRGLRHEIFSPAKNTAIVGSNPTQGMEVCLRFFCICVVLCR
jgi:hypothetical protein